MSDETIDVGDGLKVPARLEITELYRRGYSVEIAASYSAESGSYEAGRVVVDRGKDGPEITGELLRLITVAKLLRRGVLETFWWSIQDRPPANARDDGPTPEVLRWVARLYRLALLSGDAPTQAVAEGLGVPRSTAARWATRARDQGLLTVSDPRGGRRV
ncbi:hypothetical protein Atai01_03290 [Amycolatopsis taiwanensis]|uniref:Uncharacterized protein n=1 Tax=Amycolatopsis taiwanensis TaxID=342230 RepID=A0A9W6VCF9_9PSEU|nr:hypothetical protein Atai01_03290 [Amycolatopsis taiwanensis]